MIKLFSALFLVTLFFAQTGGKIEISVNDANVTVRNEAIRVTGIDVIAIKLYLPDSTDRSWMKDSIIVTSRPYDPGVEQVDMSGPAHASPPVVQRNERVQQIGAVAKKNWVEYSFKVKQVAMVYGTYFYVTIPGKYSSYTGYKNKIKFFLTPND